MVCLCVCVWVDGWWLVGMGGGDLRPHKYSPVICKSHEL